jgi:predicted PhzF superfamily epimerase YddE/YHI9
VLPCAHAPSAADLGGDVEVRASYADGRDLGEDPVAGSADARLAQWLIGTGALPSACIPGRAA